MKHVQKQFEGCGIFLIEDKFAAVDLDRSAIDLVMFFKKQIVCLE